MSVSQGHQASEWPCSAAKSKAWSGGIRLIDGKVSSPDDSRRKNSFTGITEIQKATSFPHQNMWIANIPKSNWPGPKSNC